MLTCLVFGANLSLARTLYVESGYGDDGSDCLSKASPCQSLNHVFSLLQARDRVQVGPGTHVLTAPLDFLPGVQLTSVSGAFATVIDARALSPTWGSLDALQADGIVIGRKKKGIHHPGGYVVRAGHQHRQQQTPTNRGKPDPAAGVWPDSGRRGRHQGRRK